MIKTARRVHRIRWDWNTLILVIIVLAMIGVFSFLAPGKFSAPVNFANIGKDVAVMGIVAAALTLTFTGGAIDFSIASVMAAAGFFLAFLIEQGIPWPLASVVILLMGTGIGFVNGSVVTRFRANPFIVTLATMGIVRGAVYIVAGGNYGIMVNSSTYLFIGQGKIGPFPFVILIMIFVVVVCYVVLNFTHFGRRLCAVGGNPVAARQAGLDVQKLLLTAYLISAVGAAFGGIVLISEFGSGEPRAASGWEFPIITAVILGGTSLWGGIGKVLGTLVGVVLLGMLRNGLIITEVSSYFQTIASGVLLIAAVALNRWRLARQER